MIRNYYISELVQVLDGVRFGVDTTISGVSIDSRQIKKNDLFIAIEGELFDGHGFIDQALSSGAAGVVVHENSNQLLKTKGILVKDTFDALGRIASFNRSQTDIPFIAITGSCGKTSVKEMMYNILNQKAAVLATKGNLNNAYGVPLTLLSVTEQHRYAVVEMGTSSPGEIQYIANLTQPTVSVITNAAEAHLEELLDVEGVAYEKGFILDALSENGIAILNLDSPFFNQWSARVQKNSHRQIVSFSLVDSKANCFASCIETTDQGMQFNLHINGEVKSILLPLWGHYQVLNACCAAITALSIGISTNEIVAGLSRSQPFIHRGQRLKISDNIQIIDESYNANPASTKSSIDQLSDCAGITILVFSDMLELGEKALHYHYEIGLYAKNKGINYLISYGQLSKETSYAFGNESGYFESKNKLINYLMSLLKECEKQFVSVLIKGSKKMKMIEIIDALQKYQGAK